MKPAWFQVHTATPDLASAGDSTPGARGLFYRGYGGSNTNEIDYINFASTGNAIDFGNALSSNRQAGATGSSTRAVAVGRDAANNTIEFVEFASTGNAQDFADATANRANGSPAAMSNGTRGVLVEDILDHPSQI